MKGYRYTYNLYDDILSTLKSRRQLGQTKRVGFTIPERVIEILGEVTSEREKSKFVTQAIMEKIEKEKKKEMFGSLLRDYAAAGKQDGKLAEDWFLIDEEAYTNYEKKSAPKATKKM